MMKPATMQDGTHPSSSIGIHYMVSVDSYRLRAPQGFGRFGCGTERDMMLFATGVVTRIRLFGDGSGSYGGLNCMTLTFTDTV